MRALLALTTLLLVGCPSRAPERVERTSVALQQGETVLDALADGTTLVARELPPNPNADGLRSLVVRLVRGPRSVALSTAERPLADAQLAEGGAVVLGRDGVLSRVRIDGPTSVIDRDAFGPISVRFGKVAYVRGEEPLLEVMLADLEGGAPRALAPKHVPAWCPAIADDGSVVFVTGRSGGTELARARAFGEPQTLASQPDLAPEGPTAPIVRGDELMFELEGVVQVLGLDGRLRRTRPGVRLFEVTK